MANKSKHIVADVTRTLPTGDDDIVITVGGNNPNLPDAAVALQVIKAGFDFDDAAKIGNGKAAQSAAYACMVLWLHWRAEGNAMFPNETACDLCAVVHSNSGAKAAREELKKWFVAAILPPAMETDGMSNDDTSAYKGKRANEESLIRRGMHLAGILLNCHVTPSMFNMKYHSFTVAPSKLLMDGWSPVGRSAKENEPVLLNRQQLTALNMKKQDKVTYFKASVEQLQSAVKDQMGLTQKRNANKDAKVLLSTVTPALLSSKCELHTLVEALHKAFVRNDNRPAHTPDKLTPDVWSMLADIAEESDAIQTSPVFAAFVQYGNHDKATVAPATDTDAAAA